MAERPDIRFGTDGWRAVIGDEYTFGNVAACADAVARELVSSGRSAGGVVVGYDTRFQSEHFAAAAANVVAARGIPVRISDRPVPTPALSLAVKSAGAALGIMITASHNPPEWNGFKVKSAFGGSAPPEEVERIESHLPAALDGVGELTVGREFDGPKVDMFTPYVNQLAQVVDVERVKSAGIKVLVDSMHGSGAGVIARLLEGGSSQVSEIRSEVNPSFPGMKQPEPIEDNLGPLIENATVTDAEVGLATDGDADRLGVVAEDGSYLSTLEAFSMLFHHLKARKQLDGGAASTITMSSMVDRLAEHHGVEHYRTPVGFKFVGPAMTDHGCVIGGEESGGYAFSGHIPERDGPLSGLFILESMATSGLSPSELLKEVHEITGPFSYRRIDNEINENERDRVVGAMGGFNPKSLGGIEVGRIDRTDGVRFLLVNGGWAVVRMSGTEPLVRLYAESPTPEGQDSVLDDLKLGLGI